MQRKMGLVVMMVVAVAACGGGSSDEGSSAGGSTEQFCAVLRAADLADDAAEPTVAELRALAEQAPDSLRDDVDTLVDAIEKLSAVDENDSAAFEQAFAIILSPEFAEAGERLEAFGVDECGLEPTDDGFSDADTDASADASSEAGGELDDPLYDPFFDDPIDPTVASYEGALKWSSLEPAVSTSQRPRQSKSALQSLIICARSTLLGPSSSRRTNTSTTARSELSQRYLRAASLAAADPRAIELLTR
jgi:hypothetical protein